ncbi:cupin domain-containing protein [Paralimibaculum aggregatum]|uniref:Cupin domain-containing protein n=1 Tax=Paralimibaculum aggregatum TaxID=3036245 RepID=A0ABQ6LML3_9RHOB|nr:cupin domain-containing protein [Limibaculum sp. NKW23]GMG84423.1 cupin domain-containing protein [Limibaculum sp. NKW23]
MSASDTPSGKPVCHRIRPANTYSGKQGFDYFEGIARETTGAAAICMHLLTIPPGRRARAHLHESHETAVYTISGEVVMWWGERLEHRMDTRAGDLVYIPAGMPHLPANLSGAEAVAVIARTDPHEQESVVLRPDLEGLVPELAGIEAG